MIHKPFKFHLLTFFPLPLNARSWPKFQKEKNRTVITFFRGLLALSCFAVAGLAHGICVPKLDLPLDPHEAGDIYFKTSLNGRDFTGNTKLVLNADVPTLMAARNGKLYAYFQWFPGFRTSDKKYKKYFDMIGVRISPNKGKTWTATRAVRICGFPTGLVTGESGETRPVDPAAVQLANGKIRLYFTIASKIYSAISTNGRSFRYEGQSFAVKGASIRDCTVAKLGKTWHMYCPNWKNNGKGYHATSKAGKKFKRRANASVGGRRNFLGNVVNVKGQLYFYSNSWVASSKTGTHFRLLHKKGLPGDPGIAYLKSKWYGLEHN